MMKKILSIFLIYSFVLSNTGHTETTTVGPGPKYVKPEEKSRSKKGIYGILIAAGVVAIGIGALVIASHQHKHEHHHHKK
ncbi:MAG: hypothetical protein ACHQT8_06190 [Chlamydiales bacterium]